MRIRLLRATVCLALALAFQAATIDFAAAGGSYRYGHHKYYRHHGYHHHHHDHLGVGIVVFLGGMLMGHLLTRSYDDGYQEPRPARVAPRPEPVRLGNCQPTTGERVIDGRRALMAGTWCTDQYGRGYILEASVRFVRYLN